MYPCHVMIVTIKRSVLNYASLLTGRSAHIAKEMSDVRKELADMKRDTKGPEGGIDNQHQTWMGCKQ